VKVLTLCARAHTAHHRPDFTDFFAVFWKMFKLHFLGVFQTPMAVGGAIFQVLRVCACP
jgi:hypothetical protein